MGSCAIGIFTLKKELDEIISIDKSHETNWPCYYIETVNTDSSQSSLETIS